jgi:hypothetical protein
VRLPPIPIQRPLSITSWVGERREVLGHLPEMAFPVNLTATAPKSGRRGIHRLVHWRCIDSYAGDDQRLSA